VRLASCLVLYLTLVLAGCATPRFVVLSDPLDAREHNDLGVAYEAAGKTDQALESYAAAARKDPSWDQPLINRGNAHAAQGNWTEAEASYRQALKRNPGNPEAMNNLAFALLNREKTDDALEWSARAVDMEPDNPVFMATRAQALAAAGNAPAALELLRDALGKLPAGDPLREHIAALRDRIADVAP
jgi:tetratricopeptide (TPR) repeat protein